MSPCSGWNRRHLPWSRIGDEVTVANRDMADGEFDHPVEDEPAAAGLSPVETEGEFVEVALQMCVIVPTLVGAE